MIFKSGKIIPQKVTVNVRESINTFLCTGCNREPPVKNLLLTVVNIWNLI